jgi:hypothetical protein
MSKEQENRQAFEFMMQSLPLSQPGVTVNLSAQYTIAPITPVSGEWYLSADCSACLERNAIVGDPSQRRVGKIFSGPGSVCVRCSACGRGNPSGSGTRLNILLTCFSWGGREGGALPHPERESRPGAR